MNRSLGLLEIVGDTARAVEFVGERNHHIIQRMVPAAQQAELDAQAEDAKTEIAAHTQARLAALASRETRLVDAFLDNLLSKELFDKRQRDLVEERRSVEDELKAGASRTEGSTKRIGELLELASTAQQSYELANTQLRRELVLRLTSNRVVSRKNVSIEPCFQLSVIAKRDPFLQGASSRNRTYIATSARSHPIH